MKLIIFGATGLMGKELIRQALLDGHEVRAYGRNVYAQSLPDNEHLELTTGTMFDDGQLYSAMKGCDAVLSALGGAADDTDKTRSLGMKHIVMQMEKAGIKRIVGIGGMGILDDATGKLLMDGEDFPPEYVAVSKEHLKGYQFLKESNLDWTFVCPPMIIAGEPGGVFSTAADHMPEPNTFSITAGDLALFMLKEVTQQKFIQQRVGISN